MTKKKDKPQVADSARRLSKGVPARLFDEDYADLVEYEKMGLNMSDLIRRCVNKSLGQVVAEVRDEIQQRLKSVGKQQP